MKYGTTYTLGLNAFTPGLVRVEAVLRRGLPGLQITGLSSGTARGTADRIRLALLSAGVRLPRGAMSVNLAPVDQPKSGGYLDLTIAATLLSMIDQIPPDSLLANLDKRKTLFLGELSLTGEILELDMLFPFLLHAQENGFSEIIMPASQVEQVNFIQELKFTGIRKLEELLEPPPEDLPVPGYAPVYSPPSSRLDGIQVAPEFKKALMLAAAGKHHMLLIGPPGTGKSMLAGELASFCPEPDEEELLEILTVRNVLEKQFVNDYRMVNRPFRAPHHTATPRSLVGGGLPLEPGEVTRAHNGILFLDELAEFSRVALQSLREPLQEGLVRISRGNRALEMPARLLLVAATNPCPCGYYGDTRIKCTCTVQLRENYLSRIQGPLKERIDMEVQVLSHPTHGPEDYTTAEMRKLISQAVEVQKKRYRGTPYRFNGEVEAEHLEEYLPLANKDAEQYWESLRRKFGDYRIQTRIRRLAGTISDLSGVARIRASDLIEATSYRILDKYRLEREP